MRINYDLDDLRAFCCLVRDGQFTIAASTLCITTSALSRRIAKLEAEIGGKLFERTTRRLEVTPLGHMLFERVVPALGQLDASVSEAARATQGAVSTLAIGTVASVGYSVLPHVLPALYAAAPNLYVQIRDANATVVTKLVEDAEVEFGITTSVVFPHSLAVQRIGSYDFNLIYGENSNWHPPQPEISWRDLETLPVVGLNPLSSTRLQIDSVLHANGIARPWKLEVDQLATMIGLVQTSGFVAVMPALFDVEGHGLRHARIRDPDIVRDLHVIHRSDRTMSEPARRLVALIHAHVDQAR